ncbi:hypothetical protein [Fodinicurvata halophila]|uniref:hypothetical protein n=1 Tax=Fodinicurvata halophila TaxID=1419723 RepID=UPI003640E68D
MQIAAGSLADFLPTGAVTALFGSPLLLLLLPRLRAQEQPPSLSGAAQPMRRGHGFKVLAVLLALLALMAVLAVLGDACRTAPGVLSLGN